MNTTTENDINNLHDFLQQNYNELHNADTTLIDGIEKIADNLNDKISKKIISYIRKDMKINQERDETDK